MSKRTKALARQRARNRQAFIDLYNKAVPNAPYGSKAFKRDVAKKGSLGGGTWVTPSRPPAGTYDPDIDAQERTAERQNRYNVEDVGRGRERLVTDFGVGQQEIGRSYNEGLADLLTERTRAKQDYGTTLQTIARNFQRLGNVQAQQGRQAGLSGGFEAQAAQKRAANEKLERAPVDLGYQRFQEGSKLAEQRLGEARDRETGRLNVDYRRGQEDFTTTETRSGEGLEAFRLDASAARQAQYGGPLQKTFVPSKQAAQATRTTNARAAARTQRQRARAAEQRAVRRARRRARGG